MNRLAREASPYLRQHAHNPVDWYPWGPEALARARELDRPIFLSIGYSACHWCHVMERESFDDPAVAEALAADFVAVKVDREERPDLDGIYMRAVQALTGRGGWPLSAFLTPDGRPFYGGTYYPPEPRHGMPSFRQVLRAVADAWRNRRPEVLAGAEQLRAALAGSALPPGAETGPGAPGAALPGAAAAAFELLRRNFDPVHGGFGGAPKFPQPVTLEFLLAHHAATGDPSPLELVVHTLRHMARGGIRDHLGGGFHRYSVDASWLVPHFEKMLYDNALLARIYTDAWRATGLDEFRDVAASTLDYVLSDLRHPEGGFFSARDADSEGEEGRFYVWTDDELSRVAADQGIGDDDVGLFRAVYGVEPDGNFEGRSILHVHRAPGEVARDSGTDAASVEARLAPLRAALLAARALRPPPFRDEKVLCSWTAFTVRALAEAGVVFDRADFLEAAEAGGRFLDGPLRSGGRLRRVWMEGTARIDAFLEDHAAAGNAFLTLHEASGDPAWLAAASREADETVSRFWSPAEGVFHDTAHDAEALVVRPREILDTATPSGNSLAVELLLRAGHALDRPDWIRIAEAVLERELPGARRYPAAFGRLLTQAVRATAPPVEVAVVGDPHDPRARALRAAAWTGLHPHRTVLGGSGVGEPPSPLLRGRGMVEGGPAAWVCRGWSCEAPLTDPGAVADAVRATGPRAPGRPTTR